MSGGPALLLRNDQSRVAVDTSLLRALLLRVFRDGNFVTGEVSVAIVDGATMHRLNREYLEHDFPTDVLSFVYSAEENFIEGEIIASADYAAEEAERYNWPAEHELLLYLVHGALHLVGYDDLDPDSAATMRRRERAVLLEFGLFPPGRD